jgi:hypothetical protein
LRLDTLEEDEVEETGPEAERTGERWGEGKSEGMERICW